MKAKLRATSGSYELFDFLVSTSYTYRIILPEVLNLEYVIRKAAESQHFEEKCEVTFRSVGPFNPGVRYLYQDITAEITIRGENILDLYEGIKKPLSPLTMSPASSINSRNPDQIEYEKLLFELGQADRIEKITRNHNFLARISRVQNPSSIFAIPYAFLQNGIVEKMERFLELHSQLKNLEKIGWLETEKLYVMRTKKADKRVQVVS